MRNRLVQTSRFLSYVLRHSPQALGLDLDPGGWADVDALLERAWAEGHSIDRVLLEQVTAHGEKERFSLSADGTKIRASHGHSGDVDLDLTPTIPPKPLYHGTACTTLSVLRDDGLCPKSRQHVHLSDTREETVRVGSRHGTPVVLIVDAQGLDEAGRALHRTTDATWLTDRVPTSFLHFPGD